MNDEQIFLANAYVDGELTADERRRAEADPVVMAEVGELRSMIAALRAPEPIDPGRRDHQIHVALADFGAAPPSSTPRTPVTRYVLAVAAAIMAVAALSVVVGRVRDNASSIPAPDQVASEAVSQEVTSATQLTALEQPSVAVSDAADESSAASDDMSIEFDMESSSAEESGADEVIVIDPDEPISRADQLAIIADMLIAQRDDRTLAPTPEYACDAVDPESGEPIEVLAYGHYIDVVVVRDVLIGVVEHNTVTAYALDPDNCEVLLST